MKNLLFLSILFIFSLGLVACSDDDDNQSPPEEETIELPISGEYVWEFEIPNMGSQVSMHDFGNEVIHYTMSGDVYNVVYDMDVKHYQEDMHKVVALGREGSAKEGVYFAFFLKDMTANSVNIYKAEFTAETAEQDALDMDIPAIDDMQFHGWNVYEKN